MNNTSSNICELCFVEHGIQKQAQYDCATNLGSFIKLCKKCLNKNETIIIKYKKIGTEIWYRYTRIYTSL